MQTQVENPSPTSVEAPKSMVVPPNTTVIFPKAEPAKPKTLLRRLHAIQGEVEDMKKEGWNDFSKYQYLTASQVVSRIKELMDKHGVLFAYSTELLRFEEVGKSQKAAIVKIDYTFFNADDEKDVLKGRFDSLAGDTGDKQVFKAVTGGIKYIFTGTFCIANEDDPEKDKQGNKREKPKAAQTNIHKLKAKLVELGARNDTQALELLEKFSGLKWQNFTVTETQASIALASILSKTTKNGQSK